MKKFISVISIISSLPFFLPGQCECPPLPDDQAGKTVVIVSTVAELQNALLDCDANGGNYSILLENGTYELNNNLLYINQGMSHLTIRSLSGNRDSVIVKGQGMGGNVGWIFNVAGDNFTAADMTIGWVGNHAIQIHAESDADHCLIQNVRFVNMREQMLKVSGNDSPVFSDGGVVQCCLFEFPDGVAYQYYTGGIDAHRAKDWEVRNNTFKHIRSPDNSLAEHAVHFWSDSENTLVENNLIINCDRGIGFGLGSKWHFGGIIRNNFVHTSRDVGIGLENSPDTKVYNNTVVTDNYFNSIEYRFENTTNVHIANNLINENIASRNGGTGTVESNFQFDDLNIFEDPANYDYHLDGAISGIVDAGMDLADVILDFDCHPRSTGGIPDIGADEFDSILSGVSGFEKPFEISVFPNPAGEVVFINTKESLKLELFSPNGRLLIQKELVIGINEIGFSKHSPGIYILKYRKNGITQIQKLVRF